MAISFIPNQPILFQDPLFAGQTCLNNDVREYAQLAEAEDNMCIQFINEPVATLISCSMNEFSNELINGDFATNLNSFDEYDFSTGTNTGAPVIWTWSDNGAQSNPFVTNIGLVQTLPGAIGDIFLISFEFTYDNADTFLIGVGSQASNSFNTVNLLNNFETNIDGRKSIILSSYLGLDFAFYCDNSAVTIKNIIVRNITSAQCVVPNSSVNAHWTYVESINGWQKVDGSVATAFPLTIASGLVNGTNYRMSYKITNMPEDGIAYMEIQDAASNTLGKTYVNGEFSEYLTPYTGPSAQPFILANAEAQNGIIYDITFEEMCYNHYIKISYPDNSAASINYSAGSATNPLQYYKDRIIWCFTWEDLEDVDVPGAPLNSGCYNITITDGCGGPAIDYQSYTTINYKATGTHDCSVMVEGTNQGYAFGFFFNEPGVNIFFRLKQRLRLLQFNPSYPAKTEQYLYSNGTMFRSYAQSGKVRIAWFDYVDEPTHDVIRLQILSDTLLVGAQPFFCVAEDYEPEWAENGRYNLAQSRVALMAVNEPTVFNRNCL